VLVLEILERRGRFSPREELGYKWLHFACVDKLRDLFQGLGATKPSMRSTPIEDAICVSVFASRKSAAAGQACRVLTEPHEGERPAIGDDFIPAFDRDKGPVH
jgi:hypothetical protein